MLLFGRIDHAAIDLPDFGYLGGDLIKTGQGAFQLLAVLFRALVIREIGLVLSGRPPTPVRPELLQGATWRAARSGLEGNLVNPADASQLPARELVGQLRAELRPALEATGAELDADVPTRLSMLVESGWVTSFHAP